MGASKSDFFTLEQNEISQLLKALAHPARIAIVEYLMKINSCVCNDIVNEIPLAQPTISQHLKELKTANIIKGSIEGNSICYCINYETLKKIETYMQVFLNHEKTKNSCC